MLLKKRKIPVECVRSFTAGLKKALRNNQRRGPGKALGSLQKEADFGQGGKLARDNHV